MIENVKFDDEGTTYCYGTVFTKHFTFRKHSSSTSKHFEMSKIVKFSVFQNVALIDQAGLIELT